MAELKEDKLIVKQKETIVSQAKDEAIEKIKWVWWFLKEELPQFLSNWRTVPRIMMVLYGLVFAGAAWFGLYVNGKKTDINTKK